MCNLSQGIAERAAEEAAFITTEKIIKQMSENKFTLEQIALATGKTIKKIEKILRNCG